MSMEFFFRKHNHFGIIHILYFKLVIRCCFIINSKEMYLYLTVHKQSEIYKNLHSQFKKKPIQKRQVQMITSNDF